MECDRYFHLKCSGVELPATEGFALLPQKWTCSYCDGDELGGKKDSGDDGDVKAEAKEEAHSSTSCIEPDDDLYTTEEGTSSVENHQDNGYTTYTIVNTTDNNTLNCLDLLRRLTAKIKCTAMRSWQRYNGNVEICNSQPL